MLLSLIGMFSYPEREELYAALLGEPDVTARSDAGIQLMQDFGFPDGQIELMDKFVVTGFGMGGTLFAGAVKAETSDGRQKTVGDLSEIRAWAYSQSEGYEWAAFILIIAALFLRTVSPWLARDSTRRSETSSLSNGGGQGSP